MLALTPDMRIEVGGHTDNVGVDTRNQILSENRAKSVVDFLVGKGVDPKRLTWKGYGADKPIGDNKTHEGRAANRRTEIRITSI
jgi:outer membrane protein OmpA-like peptidoglycan-associated protein